MCLNDTSNHYISGKWVDCKRANPKNKKSDLSEINSTNHSNNYNQTSYQFNKETNNKIIKDQEEEKIDTQSEQRDINLMVYQEVTESKQHKLENDLKNKPERSNTLFISKPQNGFIKKVNQPNDDENNTDKTQIDNNKISSQELNKNNNSLFKNYFNNVLKDPRNFDTVHYTLYDENGEDAGKLAHYQNSQKMTLFKNETEGSTSDKDSDHSLNDGGGSGSNSGSHEGEGSNNSNSNSNSGSGGSEKLGLNQMNGNSGSNSGSISNSNNGSNFNSGSGSGSGSNSQSNFLKIPEHSKPSSNSSNKSNHSLNLNESYLSIASDYKDNSVEIRQPDNDNKKIVGPKIKKLQMRRTGHVNNYQPY